MDKDAFRQAIEEALDHLHDIVALRVMPLCDILTPETPRQQRGWALSRRLLESVEALRTDQESGDAWPRRRYDILAMRYVTSLTPDQVALRLSISRRHFYRQLQRALDEYADYLWLEANPAEAHFAPEKPLRGQTPLSDTDPNARLDLLRQEANRQASHRGRASLQQCVARVVELLTPLLNRRDVELHVVLSPELPMVAVSPEILRQLLLALISEMLQNPALSCISIGAEHAEARVLLAVEAGTLPRGESSPQSAQAWQRRASVELARLQGVEILAQEETETTQRVELGLPQVADRTVLVVDDNEDVCALFRRYLIGAGYAPLIANTGSQAINLARRHTLYAITLDLMMAQEDGWDVLQALSHDPQTASVPVIVCSVLDQQDLARMMGAHDFIKKPVMAQELITALKRLETSPA